MFLTLYFTLNLVAVAGAAAYYGAKGVGKGRSKKTFSDPYSEDRFKTKEMIEREKRWKMMRENNIANDYELWLYNHRKE